MLRSINMSGSMFCEKKHSLSYVSTVEVYCDMMQTSVSPSNLTQEVSNEVSILAGSLGTLLAIACVLIGVLIVVSYIFSTTRGMFRNPTRRGAKHYFLGKSNVIHGLFPAQSYI